MDEMMREKNQTSAEGALSGRTEARAKAEVDQFHSIADYYDAMYVDAEEYGHEAGQVICLAERYNRSGSRRLLDIACGTGAQAAYLARTFQVTGIDLSGEMLAKARLKVPEAEFCRKDMFDFRMKERFGVAVNLYGSIGFADGYEQMARGLRCVYDCLEDGGVFFLTPWDTQEHFTESLVSESGERDGIKFCRMEAVRKVDGRHVEVEMFHLTGCEGDGDPTCSAGKVQIRQFHHVQKISLFSEQEYRRALEDAGFTIYERLTEREFRMGAFVCGR